MPACLDFRRPLFWIACLFLFPVGLAAQPVSKKALKWEETKVEKGLKWLRLETDQLFDSRQHINVLEVRKQRNLSLLFADTALLPTSAFAKKHHALAAVNGGFFNMEQGGSVTYLKVNWETINDHAPDLLAKGSEILEGAFIITPDRWVEIEPARSVQYYELTDDDRSVLITGPMLLHEGQTAPLEDNKFNDNRHPRTCACLTDKNRLLLVTVDGRNPRAQGMSLSELTRLLQALNCREAVNLDGGGSTTMYLRGGSPTGVINRPSDNKQFDHEGERPVANVIVVY